MGMKIFLEESVNSDNRDEPCNAIGVASSDGDWVCEVKNI
jgi:hypothetical protein